ncbi:2-oxo-4-hydroxy-4-carboxy-5-ureidoimidazoline decarboxylase [Hydrogenophaga sp.]|uniref:2-oxo-4-hydroxy-4-carboxy-5-ureidoimidazoline decarboxylase n=1 Tax=Hydrogenophaga sp. TaxID=1904254 RepID=UPI0027269D35|nr:2-oxo-4-hydroxy-4-carboxy-5-ureidoimidazoline decarboxylase [Hydrogenophaga sp.]MDO8904277.1 2-oxo-4-hydroxy-4-carboxy-5-ureidoimidazoline decarboxylase [Hydrogenophaga sp.]
MTFQPTLPLRLATLNTLDQDAFCALLGGMVEHSPWVARQAWGDRPFASLEELYDALARAIRLAARSQQVALLRVHPELAGSEATAGAMTADSNSEQGRLGLLTLHPDDLARLTDLNRRYRERFGFPYVAAMRLHGSLADVFRSFEQRLHNDPETELAVSLLQVCEVMRGRLARTVLADAGAHSLCLVSTPTRSLS